MRQLILSTLILFTSSFSFSQNLGDKIGQDNSFVVSVNGAKLLEKISIDELDKSVLFKEALEEFSRGHELPVASLMDYGVDFQQRMFLVSEYGSDDVNFNYFSYVIGDIKKFENTVENKMPYKKMETKDGIKIIHYNYDSKLFWDGKTAILMMADYVGREFRDDSYFYWDDYLYNDSYSYEEETTEVMAEEAEMVPLEEMSEEEWKEYFKIQEEKRLKEEEERQKKEEERKRLREEKRQNLKNKVELEMLNRAKLFFSDELKNTGKSFKADYNNEAVASLWFANNFSFLDYFFYGRYMGRYNPMRNAFSMSNLFGGVLTADLLLNESSIDIDASMAFYGELNETYEKILSQKIDKQFVKYLSEDDLGYFSSSFDTEEALNAYPTIVSNMMTLYDSSYAEEYSIVADLVSIVVDEEAISSAITGDAVFILNDISKKEVEYYTYDYDENYNYERVLKTRMRTVPDFLFLIGSEEEELISRALKVGLRRDVLKSVAGGYEVLDISREINTQLFISYKNNIFAATSDKKKLAEFVKGGSDNKINSKRAKEIAKNSGAFYLNLSEMFEKILATDDVRGSEKRMMTAMKDDLTDVRALFSFSKGKARIFATTDVPEAEKNGATYILHFIDHMIETSKSRH